MHLRSVYICFVVCFLLSPLVSLQAQRQLERQVGKQNVPAETTAPAASEASADAPANNRTVTGFITSIVVDDPASQPDTSSAERRFAVRLTLDTVEGTVLGFAPVSNTGVTEIQKAMLDTALLAFEHGWPVALSIENPITPSVNPRARGTVRGHVRVVAIMVRKS